MTTSNISSLILEADAGSDDPKSDTIVAGVRRLELQVGEKYLILDADHGLASGPGLRRLHSS